MTGEPLARIVVYGMPAPQGSKSFKGMSGAGKPILAESSRAVTPWRQDVSQAVRNWVTQYEQAPMQVPTRPDDYPPFPRTWTPLDGPLRVAMTFTIPKPSSAPKRRVTYPCKRPDVSKLARSTEDALVTAGLIRDDARIVELCAAKRYPGEGEDALASFGAVICVWPMGQVQPGGT